MLWSEYANAYTHIRCHAIFWVALNLSTLPLGSVKHHICMYSAIYRTTRGVRWYNFEWFVLLAPDDEILCWNYIFFSPFFFLFFFSFKFALCFGYIFILQHLIFINYYLLSFHSLIHRKLCVRIAQQSINYQRAFMYRSTYVCSLFTWKFRSIVIMCLNVMEFETGIFSFIDFLDIFVLFWKLILAVMLESVK